MIGWEGFEKRPRMGGRFIRLGWHPCLHAFTPVFLKVFAHDETILEDFVICIAVIDTLCTYMVQ